MRSSLQDIVIRFAVFTLAWGIGTTPAWGFDGDREINLPDFKKENFLDIKSYQFRPELDDEWTETKNGWRITSGSIDLDFLYLFTELRMSQPVTDRMEVSYRLRKEEFYAVKPLRQWIEVQFQVHDPYYFSLFGFPAYDKRNGSLGAAVTIGQRPWNYLRLSRLEQGVYYNDKNFEEDRFEIEPVEDEIEGAYRFGEKWRVRFYLLLDRALEQFFPDEQLTFKAKGEDASFSVDHQLSEKQRISFRYRGFDFRKSRRSPIADPEELRNNRRQNLQFVSIDIFWMRPLLSKFTMTAGTRLDVFRNRFRETDNPRDSNDYQFQTWQIYAIVVQPWNEILNMDYGLYVGDARETRDYITGERDDADEQNVEAKLRISWEFYNLRNHGHLFFTTTWNADDLLNDFWDGGQMSYQTRF